MTDVNADAGRKAAEQAEAYEFDPFAVHDLTLDDGSVIKVPPHPMHRLLDDDALAAKDKLEVDLESYDRFPDIYIPEQKAKDRNGAEITLPAETKRGALKLPYRKTVGDVAEVLDPPYDVQLVRLALGDEDYQRLRAGTVNRRRGSVADVQRIWNEGFTELARRRKTDPKSDGGADVLADVAAADSDGPVEVPPPSDS